MRAVSFALALASLPLAGAARAAEGDATPDATVLRWADVFATALVGDGLRFNNPYRLATVLGSQAQSLSRTAAYADFGLGVALGDPSFIAHGLALRFSA